MITRAIYLDVAGRRREAAMYFREAARLADEHGQPWQWGDGQAQPGQLC